MHEPDFWTGYADAMELSIEGNRLIAQEIGELARDLWHHVLRSFGELLHLGSGGWLIANPNRISRDGDAKARYPHSSPR